MSYPDSTNNAPFASLPDVILDPVLLDAEPGPLTPPPAPDSAPAQHVYPHPPPLPGAVTPLGILQAFVRSWRRALVLGLPVAFAAAAACWFALRSAPATAWILLQTPPKGEAPGLPLRELLKDRDVLTAVTQQPLVGEVGLLRAQANPEEWLRGALEVEDLEGQDALRVSLRGDRPEEMMTLLNALGDTVQRAYKTLRGRHVERQARKAEAEHQAAQEQVKAAQARLQKLGEEAGVVDFQNLTLKQKLLLERLSETEKKIIEIRSRRSVIQAGIRALQTRRAPPVAASDADRDKKLEERLADDPDTRQLLRYKVRLEMDIGQIQRVARPGAEPPPTLALYQAALGDVVKELEERRRDVRRQLDRELQPAAPPEDVSGQVEALQQEMALGAEEEKNLRAELGRLHEESQGLRRVGLEADKARADVTQAEAAARKVGQEAQALRQEAQGLAVGRARSTHVLEARRVWGPGLVGGFALFGILLGFMGHELRARRIYSLEEIQQGLGLRVLGVLPDAAASVRRRLGGASPSENDAGHRLFTAAVDALRTQLLYESKGAALRVLLVTSAADGEGKTSLATQLAVSLARTWRKTILVDADLLRPAAHRVFGLAAEPGFSEVLRGEAEADQATRSTPVSRLWIMPAGHPDGVAVQALAQDRLGALVGELKQQYEYVVIDCSSALSTANALMLGQQADGVLLSVLATTSRLPQVHATCQRLAALGIRVLGAVVAGGTGGAYETVS